VNDVAAIELGGSHVSAARVDLATRALAGRITRISFRPDASRAELIDSISGAARSVGATGELIGVAAPGPFDYERGVCKIRGLAKLEALYDVNIRSEFVAALGSGTESVFLNDAEAFVLGEGWAGAARGHTRVVGITLGTGLGSGFLADGRIVTTGPTVPPGGNLHLASFRGVPVEDTISARGILRCHPRRFDGVAELAAAARDGDAAAAQLFKQLGEDLGEFVAPWLERFGATCLALGGSISRAWELFGRALERSLASTPGLETIAPAANADESPLLGAALFARSLTTGHTPRIGFRPAALHPSSPRRRRRSGP
jgi:glucokinase